jgi:photosystem II stability/assembly factor-like uncharacterized protein
LDDFAIKRVGRRGLLLAILLAGLLAAAAAGAGLLIRGEHDSELLACLNSGPSADPGAESADPDSAGGACALRTSPETFKDLSTAANSIGIRVAADSPGDFAKSPQIRDAAAKVHGVPGTAGKWKPLGKGPLIANDPTYPGTYGEGFGQLAGRVSDYSYDAKHKRLYAAVASGGVWMSKNAGQSWHSIGNRLPTQTVGSVAYSPAHHGTVIAVTGDNAFGGNTYGGLGVFRTTDNGRHWHRSRGVPTGAEGFKAAVDKAHPKVVYAATGAGLFRSTNDGRSFRDVKLPIGGDCQGLTFHKPNCFFANIVTDVVVQSKDKFGNKDGAVLAAVGWRAGAKPNFSGKPMSPSNGLYRSDSGKPGSFQRLNVDSNGFAQQAHVGRVELGAATGPQQNHGYVYALVQDAVLFNTHKLEGLDLPDGDPLGTGINLTATPTYLNGVYVSSDFGKTWKLMEGHQQFLLPTNGSALAQLLPLGFGPGIQSWYDEWIKPDPTVQSNGVPTRVVLGLEELYENRLPTPQNGISDFRAIGAYTATGGVCLLVLAEPLCSGVEQTTQNTTTHPDQHSGIFLPDKNGGSTLVAGNDGGNYTQHVGSGGDFSQQGWGVGAQKGFHTLLPYGVNGAKDGVVYAGLQDNGELRIAANGKQNETFGGDGVFTVVDPKNSDYVFEETPEAGVSVSTDGGVNWTDVNPLVDNPSFYSPLVMDPKNSNHVLTGGKQIVETTDGPHVTSPSTPPASTDWKTVENLGKSKRNVDNQVSSIAVRGHNVYAGYCGGCDVLVTGQKFFSGIATNVGGKRKPKPGTHRGWHKVKAKGLPQRFISHIEIDPKHPKTIYVTLGASDLRPYAGPHAAGRGTGISSRGGHVYKSTNGGKSFHDISGNIRRLPALWAVVRKGQLIVATTNGVYASRGTNGGRYALLGKTLPAAPVFSLQVVPGHSRQLLAASLGRGVYRYTFPKRH